MTTDAVEYLYDAGKKRRITIIQRNDGTFAYQEERFFKNDEAEGWATVWTGRSFYADVDTAKREVVENVAWLSRKPDEA